MARVRHILDYMDQVIYMKQLDRLGHYLRQLSCTHTHTRARANARYIEAANRLFDIQRIPNRYLPREFMREKSSPYFPTRASTGRWEKSLPIYCAVNVDAPQLVVLVIDRTSKWSICNHWGIILNMSYGIFARILLYGFQKKLFISLHVRSHLLHWNPTISRLFMLLSISTHHVYKMLMLYSG